MSAEAIRNADFQSHLWPPAEPLRRPLDPPIDFPADCLGEILGGLHGVLGESVQSPSALRAQSLLAAAALATQGHADVVVDGRLSPLSSFFVTVGESGERKSGTDSVALSPHFKREKDLISQYELDLADFKIERECWKKAHDEIMGNKKLAPDERRHKLERLGQEPPMPCYPVLVTNEPTMEGLAKALDNGWPSMGLFSDEGGQFLGGHAMSKEKQLGTVATASKLWDKGELDRVRGGDGARKIYGKRASLHLMIQPVLLGNIFGNEIITGQGFASRILATYPQSNIGNRPYRAIDVYQAPEYQRYFARMMELLEMPFSLSENTENVLDARRLTLTNEAMRSFTTFFNTIEKAQQDGGAFHAIRGFASKSAENATRLAGILALVDCPQAQQIDAEHMQRGIHLMGYYLDEALRLSEATSDQPDLVLAEKALAWIRGQGGTIGLSHLYQYGTNGLRNKKDAQRIMEVLESHGLARKLDGTHTLNGKTYRNVWEARPDGI